MLRYCAGANPGFVEEKMNEQPITCEFCGNPINEDNLSYFCCCKLRELLIELIVNGGSDIICDDAKEVFRLVSELIVEKNEEIKRLQKIFEYSKRFWREK